jgi:Lon-like ATP-dependent protease
MEIVRLSGYDLQEKIQIARKYLVPQAIKDVGLEGATIVADGEKKEWDLITDGGLSALIKQYCRESGVRSLEKMIQRIARKLAYKQVTKLEEQEGDSTEAAAAPAPVRDVPVMHTSTASAIADAAAVTSTEDNEDSTDDAAAASAAATDAADADAAAAAAAAVDAIAAEEADMKLKAKLAEHEAKLKIIKAIDVVIDEHNLEEYAGKPIFTQDNIYERPPSVASNKAEGEEVIGELPVGVVMGLGWSPIGGSPIFVETVAVPSAFQERAHTSINVVTGQLGSVMKESTDIAFTFARKYVSVVDADNKFFNSNQLHMHCPEGAVSKDGPSAGVAMTSSIVSCALNRPVLPRTAMTGEISLTGKVLPIGGVKEKALAAKRAGANVLLLPLANKRDYDELPDYVKQDIDVHFVSEYEEAFKILFPAQPVQASSSTQL